MTNVDLRVFEAIQGGQFMRKPSANLRGASEYFVLPSEIIYLHRGADESQAIPVLT